MTFQNTDTEIFPANNYIHKLQFHNLHEQEMKSMKSQGLTGKNFQTFHVNDAMDEKATNLLIYNQVNSHINSAYGELFDTHDMPGRYFD